MLLEVHQFHVWNILGYINHIFSTLDNLVVKSKISGTTGTTGNLSLGIGLGYRVIEAHVDNYLAIPFYSSEQWFVKVFIQATMTPLTETGITALFTYIEL